MPLNKETEPKSNTELEKKKACFSLPKKKINK